MGIILPDPNMKDFSVTKHHFPEKGGRVTKNGPKMENKGLLQKNFSYSDLVTF